MTYVRVATYSVQQPGSSDELTKRVNETLVPLYREQPGFVSLSIVDAGDYVVSISCWVSDHEARDGAERAIAWVREHTDLVAGPSTSHFGTEIVSAAAASG